jgi:hypothetical protein
VGADLFDADGRTDGETGMATIIVAFRNFAYLHKDDISCTNTVKTTKMETFWKISKHKHSCKKRRHCFLASSKETSGFDKHGCFEHSSLVGSSCAIPSLYVFLQIQIVGVKIGSEEIKQIFCFEFLETQLSDI